MPGTLNKYGGTHVDYFALKDFTRAGVDFVKGNGPISGAANWKNIETLVQAHYVVPVVSDRGALPKMFLRELRSPEYVFAKYGFQPNVSTGQEADYTPGEHSVAQVTAYTTANPTALGAILVKEVADKNRSTLVTALQTQALAMVTITPATGLAAGGTAVAVTGTATNIDAALAVVTAVKFATTNGTGFSWTSGTGTLAVTTPAHAAGAVNVTLVGFPGGDLVKTNGFTYT